MHSDRVSLETQILRTDYWAARLAPHSFIHSLSNLITISRTLGMKIPVRWGSCLKESIA